MSLISDPQTMWYLYRTCSSINERTNYLLQPTLVLTGLTTGDTFISKVDETPTCWSLEMIYEGFPKLDPMINYITYSSNYFTKVSNVIFSGESNNCEECLLNLSKKQNNVNNYFVSVISENVSVINISPPFLDISGTTFPITNNTPIVSNHRGIEGGELIITLNVSDLREIKIYLIVNSVVYKTQTIQTIKTGYNSVKFLEVNISKTSELLILIL